MAGLTLPYYFKLRMEDTVASVTQAARDGGVEQALAYELWDLRQRALEAWNQQDERLTRQVIDSKHSFIARINKMSGVRPAVRFVK